MKANYTVVAINLAGHGASERNRTDWTMGNYGEDVATVVRQLPNPQVVLVGHSMGADVALEASRRIGDRVIGIVAVDSLKSIGLPPMKPQEIERQLAPFRDHFIEATRDYVTKTMFTKGADPAFVQKVAYDMFTRAAGGGDSLVAVPAGHGLHHAAPGHPGPGVRHNSDLSPTDEARIRKSLPKFKVDVLDDTGHLPDDGSAAAVQPGADKRYRRLGTTGAALSEALNSSGSGAAGPQRIRQPTQAE